MTKIKSTLLFFILMTSSVICLQTEVCANDRFLKILKSEDLQICHLISDSSIAQVNKMSDLYFVHVHKSNFVTISFFAKAITQQAKQILVDFFCPLLAK
jgi:hypothetical protein